MEQLSKIISGIEWAIAGFIGAMIAAALQSDIKNKRVFIGYVLAGAACAQFLTGLVADYFAIAPGRAGGISFLLGVFGVATINAVLRAVAAADLWALFKMKFGKGDRVE